MILFLLLIVILLIGVTAAAVMGKIGGFMPESTTSRSFSGLPAGPLDAVGLAELHFDQALRGYRMEQVDEVIDALSARIRELESEVAPQSGTARPVTSPSVVTSAEAPSPEGSDSELTSGPREQ